MPDIYMGIYTSMHKRTSVHIHTYTRIDAYILKNIHAHIDTCIDAFSTLCLKGGVSSLNLSTKLLL